MQKQHRLPRRLIPGLLLLIVGFGNSACTTTNSPMRANTAAPTTMGSENASDQAKAALKALEESDKDATQRTKKRSAEN